MSAIIFSIFLVSLTVQLSLILNNIKSLHQKQVFLVKCKIKLTTQLNNMPYRVCREV